MTRQHIKEILPIITAYANGYIVQNKGLDGLWKDTSNLSFDSPPENYRIKPEPKDIWINEYGVMFDNWTIYATQNKACQASDKDMVTRQAVHYREVID